MMRLTATVLAACTIGVNAFPAMMFDIAERESKSVEEIARSISDGSLDTRALEKRVGFDPALQYVSNTGTHAYVAPGSTDLRGPCPGLNAMANHGYIPHNGVATITQFIQGTYDVFGMGTDLATVLAVYGAVMDGDLTSWSIGGPPSSSLLSSVGLLGTPQGISGSHNKYEADVSPTRPDLYEYGNDYKVIVPQFQQLFSMQSDAATANYDLDVLTDFRSSRFDQSVANNPYFFNGPFSGVLVQPAAYTFIYRFMSNKSAEYPEGILNQDVLKSFFAITGDSGSFKWNPGQEKIPDNWYKRAIGDEYTIPYFNSDLLAAALKYPKFLNVGGNTGTTNSFTGVDINNLTGGVYNANSLTQGDNAACFAYQAAQQAAPDLLKGLFSSVTAPLASLNSAINTVLTELSCPQLQKIDATQFSKYPGYSKLSSTGTY